MMQETERYRDLLAELMVRLRSEKSNKRVGDFVEENEELLEDIENLLVREEA